MLLRRCRMASSWLPSTRFRWRLWSPFLVAIFSFSAPFASSRPAGAGCIEPPRAGETVRFRLTDGRTQEVLYGKEGTVRVVTFDAAGAEQSDLLYADDGLRQVRAQSGGRLMNFVYEPDVHLGFGKAETKFNYSLMLNGAVLTKYSVWVKTLGKSGIDIDGCRYGVYKVVRYNKDMIGQKTTVSAMYFSADFRIPLRSRVQMENGPKTDFEVAHIEPR